MSEYHLDSGMRAITFGSILKPIISAVSGVGIDEVALEVSERGIFFRELDPAHVMLVDLQMRSEGFEEYDAIGDMILCVDIDYFNSILQRAKKKDVITLSAEAEDTALEVTIENSIYTKNFSLPLLDFDPSRIKIPHLDYLAKVEIPPKLLKEAVSDVERVSDHVALSCDDDTFYMRAEQDSRKVEIRIKRENTISFDVAEPCKSLFSVDWLKQILKAADFGDTLEIWLGNDIPVNLSFLKGDFRACFLLAPRIDKEVE